MMPAGAYFIRKRFLIKLRLTRYGQSARRPNSNRVIGRNLLSLLPRQFQSSWLYARSLLCLHRKVRRNRICQVLNTVVGLAEAEPPATSAIGGLASLCGPLGNSLYVLCHGSLSLCARPS